MERLAVCSAVISLLFLISSPSALAGDQPGFSIKVFTSPDDQFWVNSVIIEGTDEVMLVDGQLTKTNAEKVLQEIKETKKPLSIIYITHEHADHFLGLEVFKEAYPRVRIIANSAVVDRINKVYQEKIDKWKKILGSGATSHVVAIKKFDGNFINFESSKIEVIKNIQGDTDENTMLWIPGQRILIAGDVVVNNMHVYTAETDSKARGKWLNSLNKIRELKPSVVIPGHSKVGAPLDVSTAVDFTENYLLVFDEELKKAKDADSLINAMEEKFPSADFLLALERGAKANVGATFAAQLTPAQKIDRVTTLLKSLETRDPRPLAYIGSRYAQHNLRVADGPAALNELVLHSPAGTTVHTVRIFSDGRQSCGRNSGFQRPAVRAGRHPDDPFGIEQPYARPGRGRGAAENEANGPVDQCVARADRRRASFDQRVEEQANRRRAIDVFDIEPLPASHPFRTLDNALATPHIGYVSDGLYKTFYEDTVSNIRKWLDAHQNSAGTGENNA